MLNAQSMKFRLFRNIAIVAVLLIAASFISFIVFVLVYLYFLIRPFDGVGLGNTLSQQRLEICLRWGVTSSFVGLPLLWFFASELYLVPAVHYVMPNSSILVSMFDVERYALGFQESIWMMVISKLSLVPIAVMYIIFIGELRQTFREGDHSSNARLARTVPGPFFSRKWGNIRRAVFTVFVFFPVSEVAAFIVLPRITELDFKVLCFLMIPFCNLCPVMSMFDAMAHRYVFWEDWKGKI